MTFYKVEGGEGEIYILKIKGLPLVLILTMNGDEDKYKNLENRG